MVRDGACRVRPAEPGDVAAICEMARRLARAEPPLDVVRAEVMTALVEPRSILLVAERVGDGTDASGGLARLDGYLLAFCAPMPVYGGVVLVQELFVESDRRRRGIGRGLVDALTAEAAARRAGRVALATGRASSFYASLGFETSDARWWTRPASP